LLQGFQGSGLPDVAGFREFRISLFLQEVIVFFAREVPSDDVLWPNQTQSDGISRRIPILSAVEDFNHTLTPRRSSFFSTAAVLNF
jgi:hypothetical protein